jgi:hypothetical protein
MVITSDRIPLGLLDRAAHGLGDERSKEADVAADARGFARLKRKLQVRESMNH